jgi:DNA-binding response OmpR family regulator
MTVDNEPDVVNLVKKILEREGYEVATALSGKECLDMLEKGKPDLVLLDIMMPDLSGWDVYEQIRKRDQKLKVAFLSVIEVSPERKKKLIEEGLSDYIMKPFKKAELVERVKKIIPP